MLQEVSLAAGLSAVGGVWAEGEPKPSTSPNEKLNIACIGVGGQGAGDLSSVSSENVVAMCDVDSDRAAASFNAHPKATKYTDFRKMLEQKDIEAVTVSIPDHNHYVATTAAMHLGKHVYCQKPLTHSVLEARHLAKLSQHTKLATQMGTQGHAFEGYFKLVEIIQSGMIGNVTEVHVWTDRPNKWWPQGMMSVPRSAPVPATLDWQQWLGPAADRPFTKSYLPFVWRGWYDFGTGALGDMACHLMDPAFWALKLTHVESVEAASVGGTEISPPISSVIKYNFAARGEHPAVQLTWYDGDNLPAKSLFGTDVVPKIDNGSLFIGDKGKLLINHGDNPILLPLKKFADAALPTPSLKRSPGHYLEWINACKTGSPTGSNFRYAAAMTEAVLLGNVAIRSGSKIEWDAAAGRVTNLPDANKLLHNHYREGWKL